MGWVSFVVGLAVQWHVLVCFVSPACSPCSCPAPALPLPSVGPKKDPAGYWTVALSWHGHSVVFREKSWQCLGFRALVPKKWVQNNLSQQSRSLQRALLPQGCRCCMFRAVLVKQRRFLLRGTPVALRGALHILGKRRSEILDVFISLPVEGG